MNAWFVKIFFFAVTSLPVTAFARQLDNEQLLDMMQGQRYKEAATYIRSVFPGNIADMKVVSRLAYCDYMSGKLADAETSYLAVLAADSTNRTALNYLASISSQRRNYPKARSIYERMIRLDSTNATVYSKLADVAEYQYDTVSRMNYLVKANRIAPENPDIAYDLVMLSIKKKQYGLADTVLGEAIKHDPQNVALIQARAELAGKQKRYRESVEYALMAMRQGGASPQMVNLLGMGQYYLKLYRECIQTYATLAGTGNENETTFYYVALAYRQLGDLQKSNENLLLSIRDGISDNTPIYYQELSVNNEQLKKFNTSIAQLNKAEEYEARNVFNYSRARIYDQKLDDPKNALKFYRKYVQKYDAKIDDDPGCLRYSQQRIKELTEKPASR